MQGAAWICGQLAEVYTLTLNVPKVFRTSFIEAIKLSGRFAFKYEDRALEGAVFNLISRCLIRLDLDLLRSSGFGLGQSHG